MMAMIRRSFFMTSTVPLVAGGDNRAFVKAASHQARHGVTV
jgi:hypothetical protein